MVNRLMKIMLTPINKIPSTQAVQRPTIASRSKSIMSRNTEVDQRPGIKGRTNFERVIHYSNLIDQQKSRQRKQKLESIMTDNFKMLQRLRSQRSIIGSGASSTKNSNRNTSFTRFNSKSNLRENRRNTSLDRSQITHSQSQTLSQSRAETSKIHR